MNVQRAFSSPVFYRPPYVWIPPARGLRAIGPRELTSAEKYAIKYKIPLPGLRGLSQDLSSPQTLNAIASTGASTTVGILMALGTVSGPVGAAIAGLIAVGSLVANMFHGCGQTCIIATQDVNKFESQVFQPNLQAYMQAPVHTRSLQAAALNNFDVAATALRQALSDPALGAAGQRGISERLVRGGTAPWCPNPGHTGCDWYALYRDPIANDPNVVDDSAVTSSSSSSSGGTGSSSTGSSSTGSAPISSNLLPVLVIGGLILLAATL